MNLNMLLVIRKSLESAAPMCTWSRNDIAGFEEDLREALDLPPAAKPDEQPQSIRIRPKAGTASGRRTGWIKHVTEIDATKTNGYAFGGEFLKSGVEAELPAGAVLLYCDPFGSVKNGWKEARVTKLQADGTEHEILEYTDWRDDFLTIRDAVEGAL